MLRDGRQIATTFRLGQTATAPDDPHSAFDGAWLRRCRSTHWRPQSGPEVRIVDLFCGCGGLSLGAAEACAALGRSFTPLLAVDKDADSVVVYAKNLHCSQALVSDILDIVDGKLHSAPTDRERGLQQSLGPVDVLLAGPPCQGHSDLNNHTRRSDPRNRLYERVARFAQLTRPTHVIIENVPTAVHDSLGTVQETVQALQTMGYETDSSIVDLSEIGVPQRRRRHVVVASLSKSPSIAQVIDDRSVRKRRSVMWAIDDLQAESPNGIFTTATHLSDENVKRLAYLYEHDLYNLPNKLRPGCHSHGNHSYKSMYGRLHGDQCAQTITGGFRSPGQGRFIHPTQRRVIIPHEAARLQFFPDFFDFSAVKRRTSLARMIGNAVPMKLSYVLCLELLA